MAKVLDQTYAIIGGIRTLVSVEERRVWGFKRGVEQGYMSVKRPALNAATLIARRLGAIIVAIDLSRFIRAEAYCHLTNREAWPTPEEFALLRKMTGGVVLATLLDPAMTEAERLSWATKRTGKAGRPRSIDDELAARIFADMGYLCFDRSGRPRWEQPIREVADSYGVTAAAVHRAGQVIAEREDLA